MTNSNNQVPLRESLLFTRLKRGEYSITIPRSVCFGTVALGGFVIAFIHKAVVDFISQSPKTADHQHVQQASVQFFRPTLPSPNETMLKVKVTDAKKAWTTLHVEVVQTGKVCIAGYLTLTDLTRPGRISVNTGWKLLPPPVPISIPELQADQSPDWVSYLTPFHPKDFRRPQSYIKYSLPVVRTDRSTLDQWITPGWKDDDDPRGAVWTDELLHFVIDNSPPLLNDLADSTSPGRLALHEAMVKAGFAQREARAQDKSDAFVGEGLRQEDLFPAIVSTLSISTEMKRPLPKQGTKWLFMGCSVKALRDDRMDYDIVVMNADGELIAVSHHVMQVVPVSMKKAKKQRL